MHNTLLSSLLLLVPLAFADPLAPSFKLCNIIYNSSYIYSTPAHYATGSGTVSFDLTNSYEPSQSIHCSAFSVREFNFFYGDSTYACDPVPGSPTTSTNFTFSASGAITVNQTFSFNGNYTPRTDTFLAYGNGTVPLVCDEEYKQTANWTLNSGQIYSVTSQTCQPADLTIPLTLVRTS
ncbi:hypothetical protein E2P81_ATG03161 [Venturia nashicola]|uniref:AA1-like domain-containing protein n=1 Tax=Venturia nashicola TaxID=86259 RepID=A0A4Z1PEC8_9PEZI|nr:hypothetical protein E6O75_ATG03232 [Venturia nashicola]TLD36272.1 hypothetical protein E2P81_ATG03161 [Venturia nashicola]